MNMSSAALFTMELFYYYLQSDFELTSHTRISVRVFDVLRHLDLTNRYIHVANKQ